MGKVIAIASGKGGTGKTTIAAAVSSCLAVLGHKTLCIDFDTELRNLDLAVCMSQFTVIDFTDVLNDRVDIMSACSESPKIPNLFFLTAPADCTPDSIDKTALKAMFDKIRKNFEFCLIDSPAGVGEGFKLAISEADMAIIVATGDLASMRDANRTAGAVRASGITDVRLIVNRVLSRNFKQIEKNIDDVIDTVGAQLIGIIPEDINVFLALHEDTPIVLYNKRRAAYDFLDVARRLTGDDVPLQQCSIFNLK